jgi:hypothetical protein
MMDDASMVRQATGEALLGSPIQTYVAVQAFIAIEMSGEAIN